jgi:hypothetical protein
MTDHSNEELQKEIVRLKKINRALSERVEQMMNLEDSPFSLFQAAIALEA